MTPNDITVTITPEVAEALRAQAEILVHDENILPDVPNGVYVDTLDGRWTPNATEATRWAIVRIAEGE